MQRESFWCLCIKGNIATYFSLWVTGGMTIQHSFKGSVFSFGSTNNMSTISIQNAEFICMVVNEGKRSSLS